jgi:hypothetical protein
MSLLDIDRIFGDDGRETVCRWDVTCTNPANGLRSGPIGNGRIGAIPLCSRCDDHATEGRMLLR